MREIEFRGKRVDTGVWVYGDLLQSKYSNGDYKTSIMEQTPVALNYKVDPKTVGQYTNLKDKNGVKIYEGDVASDSSKNKYEAIWRGYAWWWIYRFKAKYAGEEYADETVLPLASRVLEVIGNIHDNPELLEEQKHIST